MPNRDGTGPRGQGCGQGRGRGQGRGMGQQNRSRGQGLGLSAGQGQCLRQADDAVLAAGDVTGLIAVSAKSDTELAEVDPRFGRTDWFALFEADGTFHCALDNRESDAMAHGAGLAAVQRLAQAGVKTVVTGQVGPKATAALAAAHMLVIDNCAEPTAKAAAQTALAAMAHS